MMKTVVHVLGSVDKGGAELRTLAIARHPETQKEFSTVVVTLSGRTGTLAHQFEEAGARVVPMKIGLGFPLRFVRFLRQANAHAVHSHVHLSSGAILLLARFAGVRVRIAHFRSTHDGKVATARRSLQRWLARWLLDRNATHILAVSRSAMTGAWGSAWPEDTRCQVIYNGFDWRATDPDTLVALRHQTKIPEGAPVVVHVGRMATEKNQTKLVKVFAALVEMVPEAVLLFVGRPEGPAAEAVHAEIERSGVGSHIIMMGEREDVMELLGVGDVSVLTSFREGMPGAVLEALYQGLEVVGPSIPVMEELKTLGLPITTLDLDEDARSWASEIAAALRRSEATRCERRARARAVLNAEFCLEESVRRTVGIWRGDVRLPSQSEVAMQ